MELTLTEKFIVKSFMKYYTSTMIITIGEGKKPHTHTIISSAIRAVSEHTEQLCSK